MHLTDKSLQIPRRSFLRGLGVSLALPMLECMVPRAVQAANTLGGPPRRMVFVYLPNGMHMPDWTPKAAGTLTDLPATLQPLASCKGNLQVLSGLAHVNARALGDGPGDHARANACFLTGVHPRKTAGADIHVGVSADQIAAQQLGENTRLPSLELTCDNSGRQAGSCDSGYACAYQNSISWRSENTPMPPIHDPRLIFDRLFGTEEDPELAAGRALRENCRKSILDIVREDARAFQSRLGATDRRKMDEYLTSLRETEIAIQQQTKFKASMPRAQFEKPDGIPTNFTEHLRVMYDLLALALQTDSTRVATFMVLREGSNRPYPWIDVTDGHHDLSHHGGSNEKQAKIAKINRYHMEQFAYFLGKLKGMREGSGTVLDNSMIVCGSAIADGDRHAHHDLPVLLCGGGAGALKPGRHVQFPSETPMTNLYLSLLGQMGAKVDRVGDSTGPLKNI
ncbi:MAG TPA: DUF1552 domain-containing protein [Chthoniobacteraceae bacterium]|nr:DUF1552 domain-containing protein [Chthoniobacteraceae bacterium]